MPRCGHVHRATQKRSHSLPPGFRASAVCVNFVEFGPRGIARRAPPCGSTQSIAETSRLRSPDRPEVKIRESWQRAWRRARSSNSRVAASRSASNVGRAKSMTLLPERDADPGDEARECYRRTPLRFQGQPRSALALRKCSKSNTPRPTIAATFVSIDRAENGRLGEFVGRFG